ncbi:hypothetical protein F4678DRAFT_450555 [Xylaria arbuscula]|nr:hypothetical protein F4678DRAFT_450555 [Xylaria arbuscula]
MLGERCKAVKLVDIAPTTLKPKELLICSPTILGFSFKKKRFHICRLLPKELQLILLSRIRRHKY